MRRAASHLLTMILLLAPTVAHTTTTIVPDQHGTIQAAIDSGVDTVFVRAGTYDENLVVSGSPGSRWLLSIPSSNGSHVRVLGTTLFAQRLTAQNVHFRGLVRVPGDVPSIDFTTCTN